MTEIEIDQGEPSIDRTSANSNAPYSSGECCTYFVDGENSLRMRGAHSVESLLGCVNNSMSMTQALNASVLTFAMFASPRVYPYAAHTALVNALYFERQGYAGRILGVETGDDFHPKDRRWNKVKSILNAFEPDSGWASRQEALVYIDTDLVVLSWSLDPAAALSRFPEADLILSADALDIGNTGFLIVRNTLWSRSFFHLWWDSRHMPGTFCDQHVLNKLYSHLKRDGQEHKIAILANNAVNSRWPAIETLDSTDRVLHLMGEMAPYRSAVARFASRSVCRARNEVIKHGGFAAKQVPVSYLEKLLPPQLGFSQKELVSLARAALEEERDSRFLACSEGATTEADFDRLHEAIANTCDDKRPYLSNTPQECEDLLLRELHMTMRALAPSAQSSPGLKADPVAVDSASFNTSSSYRLYLADHMTKVLYDVVYFTPKERKKQAAERMLLSLVELSSFVNMDHMANRRYTAHKRGLLHSQLTAFYMREGEWQLALSDGIKAIDEFGAVMQMTEQENPDFSGFLLEYIDTASKVAEILLKLTAYADAADWAQTALHNADTHFQTYSGEERVMAQKLAKQHMLYAETLIYTNQYDEARKQLTLARMVKLSLDTGDNRSAELRQKEQTLLRELASRVRMAK